MGGVCCASSAATEAWTPDTNYHHGARVIDNRGKVQEEKWEGGGRGELSSPKSRAGSRRHPLSLRRGAILIVTVCYRPSQAGKRKEAYEVSDTATGPRIAERDGGGYGK